ncbi:hypothetical protein KJA17_02075 [Patescibacteria group bacterium]|nr:hypothetical protein [Patescibacteria group bacterium]
MFQYNQKKFRKSFKDLPEKQKDTILSGAENAISDISKRYKIEGRKIPQLTELVRNVLMGNLSSEELPETLERELEIGQDKAQKISQEVNQFIIYPMKGMTLKETPGPEEKRVSKKDVYRETIE